MEKKKSSLIENLKRTRLRKSLKSEKRTRQVFSVTSPKDSILSSEKLGLSDYNKLKLIVGSKLKENSQEKHPLSSRDISHLRDFHKKKQSGFIQILPTSPTEIKKLLEVQKTPRKLLHCNFHTAECWKEKCVDCILEEFNSFKQTYESKKGLSTPNLQTKKWGEIDEDFIYKSTPTGRQDILNLVDWFVVMKNQYIDECLNTEILKTWDKMTKKEKFSNTDNILLLSFKEINRQISVYCQRRGKFFEQLFSTFIRFSKLKEKIENLELVQENESLKNQMKTAEKKYEEKLKITRSKKIKVRKNLAVLTSEYNNKIELIAELQKTIKKLELQLEEQEALENEEGRIEALRDTRRNLTNTGIHQGLTQTKIESIRSKFNPSDKNESFPDQIFLTRFTKEVGVQVIISPPLSENSTNTTITTLENSESQTEFEGFQIKEEPENDDYIDQLLNDPHPFEINVMNSLSSSKISDNETEKPSMLDHDFTPFLSPYEEEASFSSQIMPEKATLQPFMERLERTESRYKSARKIKESNKYIETEFDLILNTQEHEYYKAMTEKKEKLLESIEVELEKRRGILKAVCESTDHKKRMLRQIEYTLEHGIHIEAEEMLEIMKNKGTISKEADSNTWKAGFSVGFSTGKVSKQLFESKEVFLRTGTKEFLYEATETAKLEVSMIKKHPSHKLLETFLLKCNHEEYAKLTWKLLFKTLDIIQKEAIEELRNTKSLPVLLQLTYDIIDKKHNKKAVVEKKFMQIIASALVNKESRRVRLFLELLNLSEYLEIPRLIDPESCWRFTVVFLYRVSHSKLGIVISYHNFNGIQWIPKIRAVECAKMTMEEFLPLPYQFRLLQEIEAISLPDHLKSNNQGIVDEDEVIEIMVNIFNSFLIENPDY